MIVNDKEAAARLASPMNLINRLDKLSNSDKRKNAMSLFIPSGRVKESERLEIPQAANPFVKQTLEPTKESLDNILENHESQIKLGLAHDNALKLLNNSIDTLSLRLDEVRADKLPSVISAASKTVESIRKERNEAAKNNKDREVHYHFYTPIQKSVTDYETIDVT